MVALNIDFRFVGLKLELSMLSDLFRTSEHLLRFEFDQRVTRARAALDDGSDPLLNEDLQIELGTIDEVVNEHFTQMQRAQIIMSIWAVLETGINEIAEYIAKENKVTSKIHKNNGKGAEENWEIYFKNDLNFPLSFSSEDMNKVSSLRKLRNVLVHTHIRSERLNDSKTKSLKSHQGITIENYGLINIDRDLVETYVELIQKLLTKLIKQACIEH